MALNADLNGYCLTWQDRVFKQTPSVPDIKRAWTQKKYAAVIYYCGLKKGMQDAYEAIRKVWQEGVANVPGHIVGDGGKGDGIWFVNVLQIQGILNYKNQIPKSLRIAQDYWNAGKSWEGLYLAGVRRGWITVRDILMGTFTQSWVQNQGFPE